MKPPPVPSAAATVRLAVMARRLRHRVDYELPLAAFHRAMTSPEAIKWRTERQGGRLLEISSTPLDERTVTVEVVVAHSIPALNRYGVKIQRADTWTRGDSSLRMRTRVLVPFIPGTLTLSGQFDQVEPELVSGDVRITLICNVPFAGRRLENILSAQFQDVAGREQLLIAEWICANGLIDPPANAHSLVTLGPWTDEDATTDAGMSPSGESIR